MIFWLVLEPNWRCLRALGLVTVLPTLPCPCWQLDLSHFNYMHARGQVRVGKKSEGRQPALARWNTAIMILNHCYLILYVFHLMLQCCYCIAVASSSYPAATTVTHQWPPVAAATVTASAHKAPKAPLLTTDIQLECLCTTCQTHPQSPHSHLGLANVCTGMQPWLRLQHGDVLTH